MTKKNSFATDFFPFHVTARTLNKAWFPLPISEMWELFSTQLYLVTLAHSVRIHAFVLMSNHFHLLITAPQDNLEKAIADLLRRINFAVQFTVQATIQSNTQLKAQSTAQLVIPLAVEEIQNEHDLIFTQSLCQTSAIRNRISYQFVYKYVYRNPVEAQLCGKVEAYKYSTLRGLLGMDPLPFPAFDNMNLIANPREQLNWLNSPYPTSELLDEIRQGLRGSEFDIGNSNAHTTKKSDSRKMTPESLR